MKTIVTIVRAAGLLLSGTLLFGGGFMAFDAYVGSDSVRKLFPFLPSNAGWLAVIGIMVAALGFGCGFALFNLMCEPAKSAKKDSPQLVT